MKIVFNSKLKYFAMRYFFCGFQHEHQHLFQPTHQSSRKRLPYYTKQYQNQDTWINVILDEKDLLKNREVGLPNSHYRMFHHPNPSEFNPRHHISVLLRNLTPASNYEARVQARNMHGWNEMSPVFHFSTRAEGESNAQISP